ncbi:tetratricopeptide repeat protein [Nocardia sp. NPDC005978]|uniref:tetratricopeptide repeat protein n=1 Tax=Nocardia sp. NPDC005978 TaxID=3156725 RepID=UPI00339E4E62
MNEAFERADALERQGDTAAAVRLFEELAASEYGPALSRLGLIAVERGDEAGAEGWWERAAAAGHAAAMFNLGLLADNQARPADSERWFRAGAAAGDTDAAFNLAHLLEQRGDTREAIEFYRVSAAAGDVKAMYNVGSLLFVDRGKFDYGDEYRTWWQRGADAGEMHSAYSLAVAYEVLDPEAAVELFRAAIAAGHPKAEGRLAAFTNGCWSDGRPHIRGLF